MTQYKTLKGLLKAHQSGKFKGRDFLIVVDNDFIGAQIRPEIDEDGEELGETTYLWTSESPREALHDALKLLGLQSEDC